VNSRILFVVILILLAFAVLFCVTQLERVPHERWTDPSREASINPYLALERWMKADGISYRILDKGDIATILESPEKTVFVGTSCFDWAENKDALTRWIEEGGVLIISKDSITGNWDSWNSSEEDEELDEYLTNLGIAEYSGPGSQENEESPFTLDQQKSFRITGQKEPVDRMAVLWNNGSIRLITLYMGKGRLTLTGKAYFLASTSLAEKPNADLTWDLLLKPGKNGGILFFRTGEPDRHFFGNLLDRGNPAAFVIAAALLIITGFWMVIPLFGRIKPVPKLPGKPLRERFLAEGRFLKKNGALDKYLEYYRQELELRRRAAGTPSENSPAPEVPGKTVFVKVQKFFGATGEFKHFMEEQKKFILEKS
jgi:hypothetical protein